MILAVFICQKYHFTPKFTPIYNNIIIINGDSYIDKFMSEGAVMTITLVIDMFNVITLKNGKMY